MAKFTKNGRKLGWKRSLPDVRDRRWFWNRASRPEQDTVDLRSGCSPIRDQGNLGCCTGFGITAVIEYDLIKLGRTHRVPLSPLFVYYNERDMEGDINQDDGADIRDGIKTINTIGACSEAVWPYIVGNMAVKPTPEAYADAQHVKSVAYEAVDQHIADMEGCLAAGFPFVIGISVYDNFPEDSGSFIPMPQPNNVLQGGHCMVAVGYDRPEGVFIVRNHWSDSWGDKGYATIPYLYLTNPRLSSDFWKITTVTEDPT